MKSNLIFHFFLYDLAYIYACNSTIQSCRCQFKLLNKSLLSLIYLKGAFLFFKDGIVGQGG